MILGEMEFTGYKTADGGKWVSASDVKTDADGQPVTKSDAKPVEPTRLEPADVEKQGDGFVVKERPEIKVESRAHKIVEKPRQRRQPRPRGRRIRRRLAASLRNVYGPLGSRQALEHGRRQRRGEAS